MAPRFLTLYWLGLFAVFWWWSDSAERVEWTLIAIPALGVIGFLALTFLATFNDKKHKAKSKLKRFMLAIGAIFHGVFLLLLMCFFALVWYGVTRNV